MRKNACEISAEDGSFKLNRVNEGQRIGYISESTADELKVKPRAREPSGKVSEKSSAYASDLLIVQNASEEQSERYEEEGYRYNEEDSQENIRGYVKSEDDCNDITNDTLRYRYGDYRKSISEYEIEGRKGRRIKSLQKRGASK